MMMMMMMMMTMTMIDASAAVCEKRKRGGFNHYQPESCAIMPHFNTRSSGQLSFVMDVRKWEVGKGIPSAEKCGQVERKVSKVGQFCITLFMDDHFTSCRPFQDYKVGLIHHRNASEPKQCSSATVQSTTVVEK